MKKNKGKLAVLKYNAIKLRGYKQLPLYLCYLIQQLDGTEDENYVKYLMELSKHLLRVRNYYKWFPQADNEATVQIKEGLKKLGYKVLDMNA